MELWITGRARASNYTIVSWELMGVFDSKNRAIEACTEQLDFVAPVTLNERQPDEPMEFPGIEWPRYEYSQAA
jgi:LmbE family N-acetylglucosaminyl deacetylase